MTISSRSLLAASVVFFALASPAATRPPSPGVALHEGVVIDTARSVAYVMHPQGGIQAFDLERGSALWRSTEADRPLALTGDLLVAQERPGEPGELRIVALDVRRRGALRSEADLPLPAGLRADVADSLRQAFRVTASPSPQGILVAWESESRPSLPRRAVDLRDDRQSAVAKASGGGRESSQGTALFDPRAGRLLPVEAAAAKQLFDGPQPGAAASLSAPQAAARLFASADGRHALASRLIGDAISATPYRWTVSERSTGAVLGSFQAAISMTPFVIVGTRLVQVVPPTSLRVGTKWIEQPLRLRAVDLATGRELWSRDIRDTEFRGPFPL